MKKLLVAIIALFSFTQIWAYNCKVDDICYNLNWSNQTATVTYSGYPNNNDYTGHYGGGLKGKDIVIPSTILYNDAEYVVTSIGDDAFYDSQSNILMSSITLPNSVTTIGARAFYRCTALTSITIPSSVTSIGNYAFYYCSNMTSVIVLNETPVEITANVFTNCANATLYVPEGCKAAYEAADYWKEFKEIVEMLAPSPNITFADANVKALCVTNWDTNGDGELSEKEAAAVTSLNEVFKVRDIKSFNELQYFTGLTTIGDHAFSSCQYLSSVSIPNNVTRIDDSAFMGCEALSSIALPDNVTTIGDNAFRSCSGLTTISIPNNLTIIGDDAFNNCSSMTSINIPNGVTKIGRYAFKNCSSMTSISIPNSLTSISDYTFCNCTGLTSVTIPNSVTIIGNNAFDNCPSLSSLNIPNSLISIGIGAFAYCSSLTSVTIPSTLTTIGSGAFNYCSKLKVVTIEIEEPLSITSNTFYNRSNSTLYVPKGSKTAYEVADYWKEFKEIVEMAPEEPDGVLSINETTVRCGSQFTIPVLFESESEYGGLQCEVTLPAGVTLNKVTKTARLSEAFTLTKSLTGENTYQILLYNIERATFTGNDGALFNLVVDVADNMAVGNYEIQVKDIVVSDVDNNESELEDTSAILHVEDYLVGDANRDGKVNVTDIMAVANYILKYDVPGFNEVAADVNGDGKINVTDIMGIANIILQPNNANNAPMLQMEPQGDDGMDPE